MFAAFSNPRNRTRTLIFLAICLLLAVAAILVGIDDNPVGIALALLSGASLVLAFVHHWSATARFLRLLYADLLAIALCLVLGIGLSILVERVAMPAILFQILGVVATAFLLGAAFVCIPALVVGLVGALVTRNRRKPSA